MEFDKSKVYTAVNADELKVGSKVIVASSLGMLKNNVLAEVGRGVLQEVESEFEVARFVVNDYSSPFVYLVSEPEEKKLKWTDLKIGDIVRNKTTKVELLVTGIDRRDTAAEHVKLGGSWTRDSTIENWEKVE